MKLTVIGGSARRCQSGLSVISLIVVVLAGRSAAAKEPPLAKLVELNCERLFGGGSVSIKKGRMLLRFPDGTVPRAFRTGGNVFGELSAVPKHLRPKYTKGTEKQFSCFGLSSGSALSRFEVGGDFKISFRLRAPQPSNRSSFVVRFNQSRGKFIQTNFFRSLFVNGKAEKHKAITPHEEFLLPVDRWLKSGKEGMLFEIVFKNGKVSVFTEVKEEKKKKSKRIELVSLDGIESPTSGNIYFQFRNLVFSLNNLAIDAKFPSNWLEDQVGRLRKSGKLVTKPPKKEMVAKGPKGKRSRKSGKANDKPPAKSKPPEVDITKPDPEIDEEL